MRAWVLALSLGACGFSSQALPSDAPGVDTRPPDAPPDSMPPQICLGTSLQVCVATPQTALTLATPMINTSTSSLCMPYTSTPVVDLCVIAGQSISIPSGTTISVTGKRPLVLLASDTLTITGVLDASSHRGGVAGPAADTSACPTNFTDPTTSTQGGGGWGGTFGGPGANGGNSPGGALGGVAGSTLSITGLGGGCPGGNGADNGGGTGGGMGGHGGGAVMLAAGQMITIDGTVNASGAGANGGRNAGGGGGGGAGGMIVLEAPTVKVPGECFANGGGGGEGAATVRDGARGGDSPAPDMAASGGKGGSSIGGDGGNGAFGNTGSTAGDNGTTSNNPIDAGGGGGGGGGTGIIKIVATTQDHTTELKHVAPPPS